MVKLIQMEKEERKQQVVVDIKMVLLAKVEMPVTKTQTILQALAEVAGMGEDPHMKILVVLVEAALAILEAFLMAQLLQEFNLVMAMLLSLGCQYYKSIKY